MARLGEQRASARRPTREHAAVSARAAFLKVCLAASLAVVTLMVGAPARAVEREDPDLDWYRQNPEPTVQRSPAREAALTLPAGDTVQALAMSRLAPVAAVALSSPGGASRLALWDLRDPARLDVLPLPDPGAQGGVNGVVFHPTRPLLYASVRVQGQWQLREFNLASRRWASSAVARSALPFGDLRISPLPFTVNEGGPAHRLYFSVFLAGSGFGTGSVATTGHQYYQLYGPKPLPVAARSVPSGKEEEDRALPFTQPIAARPISLHPQGTRFVLQDGKGCWIELAHGADDWRTMASNGESPVPTRLRQAFPKRLPCGPGEGEFLPNGLGWVHWRGGETGATLYIGDASARIATDQRFVQAPRLSADAAVLVGVTAVANASANASAGATATATASAGAGAGATGTPTQMLRAMPVAITLGDVVNAGMLRTEAELRLVARHEGLLTREPYEQMHLFYDVENYAVRSTADDPAYPYLVTTDLFWELFAAAYENLFTVSEDETAIPAFTEAVREMRRRFASGELPAGRLAGKVATAARLMDPSDEGPEVRTTLTDPEFQPRGGYLRSPQAARYFSAMRVLTFSRIEPDEQAAWDRMPEAVRAPLRRWVGAYLPFIAGARGETSVPVGATVPSYAKHPLKEKRPFPLSWGLDNEILDRVVLHRDREGRERVERLLPSGLDVATVFGNPLARAVIAAEFTRQPNYQAQIDDLIAVRQSEFAAPPPDDKLYNAWLRGLATQWAPSAAIPGTRSSALWDAKRLQTGLASWATLRHATLLVNDKTGAEGGEGGPTFEFLVRRPPRGSVEPDPATFLAIAELFERAQGVLARVSAEWRSRPALALKSGLGDTLRESRDTVRNFARMAQAVRDGQALGDLDAIAIQRVGGTMEHPYLVFKSAQAKRTSDRDPYGLSQPDPLPKVADVATGLDQSLLVGVGAVGGWQQVMPFNGLRQLSKGAVYTYRETAQPAPIDDTQWRLLEPKLPVPEWLRAYTAPAGTTASVPMAGGR